MLFGPRVRTKPLAEFLRRLAMSLESGIDVRKALASEARRSNPALRSRVVAISAAVDAGIPLGEAIRDAGDFFPRLVRELVTVGEQTGHLPEVLYQLAAHYDQQLAMRRTFLNAITWPMFQLCAALFVIGLLIWIMGLIQPAHGDRIDVLGFGLIGTRGLVIYLLIVAAMVGGIWVVIEAAKAGKLWVAPLERFVMRLPKIGTALRTLAIARFAWTLQLALDAAMDVKQALALALASTRNIEFTKKRDSVLQMIQSGQEIHEALAATGCFPEEFINAVQTGEESGRLVEAMRTVSRQYHEEAQSALSILTRLAGYGVWFLVAAFITMLIFRLAGTYFHNIEMMTRVR
jgi:type IV pilus assembly protein PilC